MVIPLMSQFLEYQPGDGEQSKQDCEQKAFHRLAARIKKAFPRLPIMLLLDGLYPNGPIMDRCRKYHWDFMIVLKDGSLPSVWEEYCSLLLNYQERKPETPKLGGAKAALPMGQPDPLRVRSQRKKPHRHQRRALQRAVGRGRSQNPEIVPKKMKYAWISSRPISRLNVHTRCNLGARYRWGIEAGFLVEKHQGYSYEHAFAKNWNAMKGYHYLMRLAHLFNTLARFSKELAGLFSELGVRAAIGFIRNTLTGPWLDPQEVEQRLNRPFRLRLV